MPSLGSVPRREATTGHTTRLGYRPRQCAEEADGGEQHGPLPAGDEALPALAEHEGEEVTNDGDGRHADGEHHPPDEHVLSAELLQPVGATGKSTCSAQKKKKVDC